MSLSCNAYSVVVCLSVRPSVSPSVTSRHCTEIAKRRITQITTDGSPMSLDFWRQSSRRNGSPPTYQILAYRWQTTPERGVVEDTWPIFSFNARNHISGVAEVRVEGPRPRDESEIWRLFHASKKKNFTSVGSTYRPAPEGQKQFKIAPRVTENCMEKLPNFTPIAWAWGPQNWKF